MAGFQMQPHLLPFICCHVVLVAAIHPECHSSCKRTFLLPETEKEAMSINYVTGDIPERAEPHAMLLNCRHFICNLPAIPDEIWPSIQSRRQDKGHLAFNPGTAQSLC